MALIEFTVTGTPISSGASSRSKTNWRARVASAAAAALPVDHALIADRLRVTVIYFYVESDLDLDNILKPVLDSMKGVVYVDDAQIVNIVAAKRDLVGSYVLTDAPPSIVALLGQRTPEDFM